MPSMTMNLSGAFQILAYFSNIQLERCAGLRPDNLFFVVSASCNTPALSTYRE
jgi:hypothetical protein